MTIQEYINDGFKQPLFDQRLLNELLEFGEDKGTKAYYVYVKCRSRKKYAIAEAINKKYGHLFPKHDSVIAAGWALMAEKHERDNRTA